MALKSITHPDTGRTFKMGRTRPDPKKPKLHFKDYASVALPAPPSSCDYTRAAGVSLSQMYLNDQLGDCVIAGMGHVSGVLTGNAGGPPVVYTDQEITALYSAIGGYVPGDDSTDNGCNETDALNYWQSKGLLPDGSHKIVAWMAVRGGDQTEIQTALWLFENLYFGIELPDAWINPMPAGPGFTWDVAGDPDPDNGHCIMGAAYNKIGVIVDTWGMLGTLTYPAISKYATSPNGGELYVVLSQDAINKASAKAPNGFDYNGLLTDFKQLQGQPT